MAESLAGILLAAGLGTRLRPLTWELPKALCPIGGTPMVDLALDRLAGVGLAGPGAVAVNAHHLAGPLVAHLDGRAHVSVEPELLGTGGALGRLRRWIDGRNVVLVNVDALTDAPLAVLLDGWDHERARFVTIGPQAPSRLDRRARLGGVLLPWAAVAGLPDAWASISVEVWDPWAAAGKVEVMAAPGAFFDAGTPASYLAANLWRSGGASVVGEGAVVEGVIERSVVWPGALVAPGEVLRGAIRTTKGATVMVRRPVGL